MTLADLRSVYQNTMAEKDRIKSEKKLAKSMIKQRRAAGNNNMGQQEDEDDNDY